MKKFYVFCLLFAANIAAFSQLSGSYTIDPSGTGSNNYTSFTSAISALSTSGVSGAVTFNVKQGTYTEQVTIPAVTGASAANTITFQTDPSNMAPAEITYSPTGTTDNIDVIWGGPDSNAIVWLINDNGVCSDSTSIQVIVSGVGLEDQRVERVRLYPNPNDGYFTLEVSAAMLGGYYEVVDGLGRVMDRGEVTSLTQGFDLSNKPKGVYRIVVTNNGNTTTEIVVIQ